MDNSSEQCSFIYKINSKRCQNKISPHTKTYGCNRCKAHVVDMKTYSKNYKKLNASK